MFARIIRDPASSTEEVSISVFNESLQIAFPNKFSCSSIETRHGFISTRDGQMKPCEAFEAFSLIVPKKIQSFKASKTDPISDI